MKYSPSNNKLKELRIEKGLTQDELASILGIAQKTYSNYEIGSRKLPVIHLIKIAKFYNVSTDYILGLTNKKIKLKDLES